jgi:stage IV sporulation protein FB
MRDPLSWSVPLFRVAGITVRLHVLFPVVTGALLLRVAFPREGQSAVLFSDALLLTSLLFLSVLLHEFGHCFGARLVDGEAREILLWPLGGLASIDIPHRPRAHFITAAAGPLMNVLICATAAIGFLLLTKFEWRLLPWSWYPPVRTLDGLRLESGAGELRASWDILILAQAFWVNWMLFLINVVLVGFPMDGGRLLQSALWPASGFRQATMYVVYTGFVCFLALSVASLCLNEVLPFLLGVFMYVTCRQQWILLETGGEESMFGYDFSQGYTSLEDASPPSRRRRPNAWQRWLRKRTQRRMQREQELREAEERRTDALLEKVQREGREALTAEELRFLKRVSDRYRNRQ